MRGRSENDVSTSTAVPRALGHDPPRGLDAVQPRHAPGPSGSRRAPARGPAPPPPRRRRPRRPARRPSSASISRPRPSRMTPWSSASRTRITPAPPVAHGRALPGRERTASVPSASLTSDSSSVSPTCPASPRRSRSPGAKPRPSSAPRSRVVCGWARDLHAHACGRRRAPARCAAPRGPRGRRARRRPAAVVDVQLGGDALGLERAQQVVQRGLEPGRLQARRVDGHEQRAHLAHALRAGGRSRRAARPPRSSAPRLGGVLGQRRQAERHAGQVLDDAVVQVGGDPPALARRTRRSRWSAAARAPRGRAAAGGPARTHERELEQQQHEQPGDQRQRRAVAAAGRRWR